MLAPQLAQPLASQPPLAAHPAAVASGTACLASAKRVAARPGGWPVTWPLAPQRAVIASPPRLAPQHPAGGEGGGSNSQSRITHTPARGATTRTTKATGAGQRAVASAVAAPLFTEETIAAEHFAKRADTAVLEAARLVSAPYGEAAAAVLSSDGTFMGSLGEKGATAATSNQLGGRVRVVRSEAHTRKGSPRTLIL
jgi:hypothetical protein